MIRHRHLSAADREMFAISGCVVLGGLVSTPEIAALRALPEFAACATLSRPGVRLFSASGLAAQLVAPAGPMTRAAAALMGAPCTAARILCFDKTPSTNWAVPWHQDRAIAVAARAEVEGFGPWSRKDGVLHVEPPAELLHAMVALRLHLDDCPASNGPLEVVRGSCALGRIPISTIADVVAAGPVDVLTAQAGDVVAMRGLTVHGSQRASAPGHRRVLHVDFAAAPLPSPLRWVM